MADILTTIKLQADQYLAEGKKVEEQMRGIAAAEKQAGAGAATATAAATTEIKKQSGLINNLRDRLEALKKSRDASFDPAKIERFNAVIKNGESNLKNLTGEMKVVGKQTDFFGQQFAKLGGILVAAFSVQQVIAFGKTSIAAFAEAEEAGRSLAFTFQKVLGATTAEVAELNQQAEELQAQTFFDDDEIRKAQNLFGQFGLNIKQTKALIDVTKDLAATPNFNNDIGAASQAVIDAIRGRGTELKKLGITLKDNTTESEKLAEVTEKLTKFSGAAADAANTYTGKTLEQKDRVEELQEALGQRLAPILLTIKERFLEAFVPPKAVREAEEFIKKINLQFSKDLADDTIDDLIAKRTRIEENRKKLFADFAAGIKKQKSGLLTTDLLKSSQVALDKINELIAAKKNEIKVDELNFDVKEKSIEQLKTEIDLIQKRKDATGIDARSAIAVREDQIKLLEDLQKKANDKRIEEEKRVLTEIEKINEENFKLAEDNLQKFEAFRKLQIENSNLTREEKEKEFAELEFQVLNARRSNYIDYGKDVGNIDTQIADNIIQNNKKVEKAAEDSAKAQTKSFEDAREAYEKSLEDGLKKQEEIEKQKRENIEATFAAAIQLLGELNNLFSAQDSQQIDAINSRRDSQVEAFDAQLTALEESNDKGRISDKKFEEEKKKLIAARAAAEKKAAEETRKIKQAEAEREKAFAIFSIILNTAIAVSKVLTNPFLLGLTIALGAAQLAIAVATPIPEFAKGTKGKKEKGIGLVGEKGAEFMYMPQGTKVVPADRTKKHSRAVDAMIDDRFEDYIYYDFVIPALHEAQRKKEKASSKSFAENLKDSIAFQQTGLSYYDLVAGLGKNNKPAADALGAAIAKHLNPGYSNSRYR